MKDETSAELESWREMGRRFRESLNPATFPVALAFSNEQESLPPKTRRPLRDLKVRMAPCQGAGMVRRYGWTLAFGREDQGCAIAAYTYGWEGIGDPKGAEGFLVRMNYVADKRAAREIVRAWPVLEKGEDLVVIYSPLERTRIRPDVVLFYVNPAQMMRLIHAATHRTGIPLSAGFSGRAASCTEGVIGAYGDDAPKVVVPGNGDRIWAGCEDHEMVMAAPASRIEEILTGLEATHRAGVRYPVPTYLRYTPEVAFTLPLSDIFKPEELAKLER
ncbi:MAG: DUF169 domain-containing protein [Deltaproteobacteria bacterium]|nr:DUF169 domain-containing protein [Deltaproteobacteria bacterium]